MRGFAGSGLAWINGIRGRAPIAINVERYIPGQVTFLVDVGKPSLVVKGQRDPALFNACIGLVEPEHVIPLARIEGGLEQRSSHHVSDLFLGHARLQLVDHFFGDQVALGDVAFVHAYVATAADNGNGDGERDDSSQFLHLSLFFTIVVSVDHTRPNLLLRRATMADQNHELRKAGLKVTLPRVKILQILENASGQHHLSAEEVYKTLIDAGEDVGLATVYRVLTQFESAGLVIRHNFDGGHAVFEMTQEDHHDHMVCLESGEIVEFVDEIIERRQQEIAEEHGYELVDHALVLYVRPRGSDITRQDSGPTNKK